MGDMRTRTGRRILSAVVVISVLSPLGGSPSRAASVGRPAAPAPLLRVGTIFIPKLKISRVLYAGVTDDVFLAGMGYWPGSALPGAVGNMVLGGHRTSGSRPLYDIQKLRSGDLIQVTRYKRTYTYVVTGHRIVKPSDMWITRRTPTATLTLFTCHPRGSLAKRYVVQAVLQK